MTFGYVVLGLVVIAIVVFIALASRRAKENSRWRVGRGDIELGLGCGRGLGEQHAVRISHSLPDLSRSVSREELLPQEGGKKVPRQTTLPSVPQRHTTFQRQLSHKLHLDGLSMAACSLKKGKDLGILQPELYRNELTRQASVDSSSGGASDAETAGHLRFSLKYDADIEGLVVCVVQATELPVKDVSGSSDPYVKVYLLPDRKKRFSTKVHRRNLNPVFNETFVFSVPWSDLKDHTLQFSVYDFDRFSRNDLIGQVVLEGVADYCDPHSEVQYDMDILTAKSESRELGEVMLSLCYLPTAGRLTVTVIKMRSLTAMDITGSSDPYVKVNVLCHGRRIKKRKTSVQRATLNPVYNEALVFDIPNEHIEDVTLLVKAIDYDRVGANELMGVVAIGCHVLGTGRDHWLHMLETPRQPVAQWHALMDSVPPSLSLTPTRSLPPPLSCLNTT
ncbi:synaptotagmin-6-like isoform X3 [Oratosquilla oratoria]